MHISCTKWLHRKEGGDESDAPRSRHKKLHAEVRPPELHDKSRRRALHPPNPNHSRAESEISNREYGIRKSPNSFCSSNLQFSNRE